MDPQALQFLVGVLGTEGAEALRKAAGREPGLGPVLVPRAALAWLQERLSYEGRIPGIENSYLRVEKSEPGYSGVITIGDQNYGFESVSTEHVAAACAVAVGVDLSSRVPVEPLVLSRLGKSIDALVRAQVMVKKVLDARAAKTELPGRTAAPQEQVGPIAPEAPKKQPRGAKPPKPKLPKLPGVSISKAESRNCCQACGGTEFDSGAFRPCICFRELAKSIRVTTYGDGYVLEFSGSPDRATVAEFRRVFRGS